MKLTNNYNLPETIVNVLKRPTYSKGKANISATELLNSPRVVQLKRRHWDDIEEDAADNEVGGYDPDAAYEARRDAQREK